MNEIVIRSAQQADYNDVRDLLAKASLPVEGVAEHFANFLVAENGSGIIGAIGLEVYDDVALLRSAIVKPALQNRGIGLLLYERLLTQTKQQGVQRVILLTNTAERYFEKKGFKRIDRESITGAMRTSAEFTGACPSSAVCMELLLKEK